MRAAVLYLFGKLPVSVWMAVGRPRGVLNAWVWLFRPLIVWGVGDEPKSTRR